MRDVELNDNYKVDRKGNVYSKRRGHYLTPKENHDGYLRIQLWDKQECYYVSIHRLVLMAYDPRDSYEGLVTNHKNGIKDDNRLENLEWVTQRENVQHAINTGLIDFKERRNNKTTSKPIDVYHQGKFVETLPSFMETVRQTGIPRHHIVKSCDRGVSIGEYSFKRNKTRND